MSEEEVLHLDLGGEILTARWATKAWESGHFDWNKLAGEVDNKENVAERWRVIRWLNDQHHLDVLDQICGPLTSDDRELTAACMFMFVTSPLRMKAEQENITPQDYIDLVMQNAELLEGFAA